MNRTQRLLGEGALGGHDPGNAEIRHLGRAVFQNHHIVRLDVPVDNALIVGMLQGLGDLHGKVERFLPVEVPAPPLNILLQGDPVHQLHHNVIRISIGGNIVNAYNIGMVQHGDSLGLGMEPATEFLILRIFLLQKS